MEFEPAQTPSAELLGVTAARGVGLLVGRTLGLQLLTAGVTIVLARLLTPADYGLFAIALAVQLVGQRTAELGLPAALIRLDEEPSRELQAAVLGMMLVVSSAIAGILLLIALVVVPAATSANKVLEVIAVTIIAMPFYAVRAIPIALMERAMKFGHVALVETAETMVFNAFALGAALAGLGAFSLAGAVPVGALAGLTTCVWLQTFPHKPSFNLARVRPLVGFGARVSVLQGVYLLKELGFVMILSAVGSPSVTGYYAMAKRLFSFPIAVASSVGRVALPALSRDSDQRATRARRITALTALVTSLPLALVAGAAQPLIHLLIGDTWLPTTDIVVIGSLGMLLIASILSTISSYELAKGRANVPIASAIVESLVLFASTLALVSSFSETGVGIALTLSAISGAIVLAAKTNPDVQRSVPSVLRTMAIAALATGAAQLLNVSNSFGGLLAALGVVTAIWVALEAAFCRHELREVLALVRPMLRRTT